MVRITISGHHAQGKTTIAFALEQFLKERGFTSVIVDDVDLAAGHGRTKEFNDQCLEAISPRVTIIQVVSTRHGEMT